MLKQLRKLANDLPVIEIAWMDAAGDPGEDKENPEDFGRLLPLFSSGYLIRANSEVVVIANDISPRHGNFRGSITIPTGWITYVRIVATGEIIKGKKYKTYIEEFDAPEERNLQEDNRREHRGTEGLGSPPEASNSNRVIRSPEVGSAHPKAKEEII